MRALQEIKRRLAAGEITPAQATVDARQALIRELHIIGIQGKA